MYSYSVGDQVTIKGKSAYNGQFFGCIGVVERTYKSNMIGVRLDGKANPCSRYDVYWFPKKDIQELEREEEVIMLSGYRVVKVSFPDSDNAVNYALYDENICVGDYVVVSTGHHGLAVGIIGEICDDTEKVRCNREVVCKADVNAFFDRKKKAERLAALKIEMDAKVKELQKNLIYEALAERDESLRALLDEFKELQK